MKLNKKDYKPSFQNKLLLFPAPVRIFHFVLAASLTAAIATGIAPGLGLHFERPVLAMRYVRLIHASAGFIAFGAVIFRTGYALVSGDYKDFSINAQDIRTIPSLLGYYLFLRKEPPPLRTKLNVGQKLIYLSWFACIIYLSLAGMLLLYSYFDTMGWPFTFFQKALPPQRNRFIKYHVTIYLIATIIVHIYLAHTEDIARMQAIFTGWVRVSPRKDSNGQN
ncbi:MAG: cytochrome b/b6 domain-containing protein [Tepidanaerobacteraceae bacterium]|jgi:Ni/Fe-hydrogenase 1 B-type cytochrome subunit|nr:cytochrome b/b6 domain-containing protein [Tepidanaerobacteraceae bacterium]